MALAASGGEWFGTQLETVLYVALSALAMYAIIIAVVRINGLRSFSQMSAFDFATTVAMGTILASTALSSDVSVPEGAVAVATLLGAQSVVSLLRRKISLGDLVDNSPKVVMRDGEILEDRLRETKMSRADLMAKLRQADITSPDQVKLVVLETTGTVNVITGDAEDEVDPRLLEGVIE